MYEQGSYSVLQACTAPHNFIKYWRSGIGSVGQNRTGKDRIGQDSIGQDREG